VKKGETSYVKNLESFMQLLREESVLMNENIGVLREIGEALDKLTFSNWNSSDRQIYEGEVQEVITYFDELERHRMEDLEEGLKEGIWKGLEEGIQRGLEEGVRQGLQRG
jgi:flagellar biosynthesis/type III secretory pathway protein FliH